MIKFHIITIFPLQIEEYIKYGIFRIAQNKKAIEIEIHDLREWGIGKWKRVDDRPFGGGAGMLLKVEPIFEAIKHIKSKTKQNLEVIMFSPSGEKFNQKMAKSYAKRINKGENLEIILLAGHYEGFDERIRKYLVDKEISIGDYVLSGGEAPSLIFIDAITRLLNNVLGNNLSLESESFENGKKADFPQYTMPAQYNGWKVPKILLSGNHKKIDLWREKKRADIGKKIVISKKEKSY